MPRAAHFEQNVLANLGTNDARAAAFAASTWSALACEFDRRIAPLRATALAEVALIFLFFD